jgi:hypothetical protein
MHKASKLLVTFILASCSLNCGREIHMRDSNFVEIWREFSPDSSKILLEYCIDIGATGYSAKATALLRISDTTHDLSQFTLPIVPVWVHWVANDTVSAFVDVFPSIRAAKSTDSPPLSFNGVSVKLIPYDYIDTTSQLRVESRQISPDGKFEMVAYRYATRYALRILHMSIIRVNDSIPKYGNFLIGDIWSDPVLNASWTSGDSLILYSNFEEADWVRHFLVSNRPPFPYKIIIDRSDERSKNRWVKY